MKIYFNNTNDLAENLLQFFLNCFAIRKNDFFNLAIPGGNSPIPFFNRLTEATQVNWEKIRIFWTDERFVPQNHHQNNFFNAQELFLKKIHIPSENIFPVETGLDSPKIAAEDYDRKLLKIFPKDASFDLIIAGMGNDGHFASLFPKSPALFELAKFAIAVPAPETAKPKLERISLTIPVFRSAKQILFIIQKSKEALFDNSMNRSFDLAYPLSFIRDKSEKIFCYISP